MIKGTKLYSILFNKCPKCQKSAFFISDNPYNFKMFSKMNSHCKECGENFEREIGFYYGAMYASYAIDIALGVALFLLMVVLLDISSTIFLFTYLTLVLVLFPWIFRKSRLLWINLFVKYNPETRTQ